jgi:hypothetical protein
MATRKKKQEPVVEAPVVYPKIIKGNHLTLTTYENGSTKLKWDDKALLKEVREAITTVKVK